MNYQSRVLVVDDQALMRNHLHRLLADEGYELDFAENGVEALRKIESFRPDLILLDVRMPVMDGFEATSKIRKWELDHKKESVPIIALSGETNQPEIEMGLRAGWDDHIAKPVRKKDLIKKIHNILIGKNQIIENPGS